MSRISPNRWDWYQTITFKIVDDGQFPFPVEKAETQVIHQADLIQYLTGKSTAYGGRVSETGDEHGVVYVRYMPESFFAPGFAGGHAGRYVGNETVGGILSYNVALCDTAEKFAQLHPHEIGHNLGMNHWNGGRSVMNNQPYQGGAYMSLWMVEDYWTWYKLFPGPRPPMYPVAHDCGDLQDRCIIFVPSIEWEPGRYRSVYLYGEKEGDDWILKTKSGEIYDESTGPGEAWLENGILNIPLRYRCSSIMVRAELIQYDRPSSQARFKVTAIEPR